MSTRTTPPFRADHVGSFLRPGRLLDARSGDFKPPRHLPAGKTVVPGRVTTKLGQLESRIDLKRRIDEASKYAPLDQLCLSPQCGFSSTVHGNDIAVQAQRAKLALVVEVAREVWN